MTFPLQSKQDSAYYAVSQESVTVTGEVEGGYTHARPRSTRAPRKTYTTGFTELTAAELATLQTFYDDNGEYGTFNWDEPTTQVTKLCRIEQWPEPKYVGKGGTHRWNMPNIKLKEV